MPAFKAVLTEAQRPSRCFLSLAGAAFGIALRIRALLYGDVTFLIGDVRFYPGGRLAKAVVLMAVGGAITCVKEAAAGLIPHTLRSPLDLHDALSDVCADAPQN